MRDLTFRGGSYDDFLSIFTLDKKLFKKLDQLIKEVRRTPFEGTGKPEALRGNFSGLWSRRITGEHRLVYEVHDEAIVIVSCKGHYGDK